MNEKRTSDKGQHSCRDAFVLLFICPMNGISFRKRHRVLCPLLIHLFCSSFCNNFFWRILIFHFSPLINFNFNIIINLNCTLINIPMWFQAMAKIFQQFSTEVFHYQNKRKSMNDLIIMFKINQTQCHVWMIGCSLHVLFSEKTLFSNCIIQPIIIFFIPSQIIASYQK